MDHGFLVYAVASIGILFGTAAHTLASHEQVYPAMVAMTQEKVQLAVVYNFLLMVVLVIVRLVVYVFVGVLTPVEIENFMENGRSIVADTILFLIFYSPTIDNNEVDTMLIVQTICCLLVLKFFHAVALIRVSRMFEIGVPSNSTLFRIASLLSILLLTDTTIVGYVWQKVAIPSTFYTWLLFEFANVSISACSVSIKFLFNFIDTKLVPWTAKSVYVFYTDLITDICQMSCYMTFMGVFIYQNPTRLPVYAIADVFQVARQLSTRILSFKKYREVTRNMENRFPSATEDEITNAESCIICRDKLTIGNSKILNCSHIFHTECLKSWAVVQQSCPTCRAELLPKNRSVPKPPPPEEELPEPPVPEPIIPPPESARPPARTTKSPPKPKPAKTTIQATRSLSLNVPDEPLTQRMPALTPDISIWERPTADTPPVLEHSSPSSRGLIESIQHARAMMEFYKSQASFWTEEIRGLESGEQPRIVNATVPDEPESLMSIIERLRIDLDAPPAEEPSDELERIRKERRQRYEQDKLR
jgi:E3 ubiquitin-protein ligase synoviolin